jgi:manganese transport protein
MRRVVTRGLAIVPAVAVIAIYGESGTGPLLILSQVVLSLQLSFAVFPLIAFTSDPAKMGEFANKPATRIAAYVVAFAIAGLNAWLLIQTGRAWLHL